MNRNKVDPENLTERSVLASPDCTTIDFPANNVCSLFKHCYLGSQSLIANLIPLSLIH